LARRLAIGTAARSARKAQLRPVQAQIEATGLKTIRIGHEQLEENNREFYGPFCEKLHISGMNFSSQRAAA
jgi:hypothetical protein